MTALLIIFAKEPCPGQVKTRLSPPLSPEEAAQLYHRFLQDILEEMAQVPEMRLAIAFSPPRAQPFFKDLAAPGTDLFPQKGADLGERMTRALARGLAAGFGPVLLRGSDIPDLPASLVSEAREVLTTGRAQVVLGPALDGGYYLVGLAEPQSGLFQGPVWSSPTVLSDTLRLTEKSGLKVHLLPYWSDIDTYADLLRFAQQAAPGPRPGKRSRQWVRRRLGLLETNCAPVR
jgi:rSAM/selenodomain-associated transferase 1